jgi:hypothetical protein
VGYLSIPNLYRSQDCLAFKELYTLEKVHGTSAHILFKAPKKGQPLKVIYYSGGANYNEFRLLFNEQKLLEAYATLSIPEDVDVTLYGEAYGGKMQKMATTYGPSLRFIVFDVMVGDSWKTVPSAEWYATTFGQEFVPYRIVPADVRFLDMQRDMPSEVAVRRGIKVPRKREGIVIRTLKEFRRDDGSRIITKHRIYEFEERTTPQVIDDVTKLKVLEDAEAIANEWVTTNRIHHVADKLRAKRGVLLRLQDTQELINMMNEDIAREAAGEIVPSEAAVKAISKKTVELFKGYLRNQV